MTQGGCRVSPAGFAHMTHMLSSLAAGKLILVLEVRSFALCVSLHEWELCEYDNLRYETVCKYLRGSWL